MLQLPGQIPRQTTVSQAVLLQLTQVHGEAEIHLQSVEVPIAEQRPKEAGTLWEAHTGPDLLAGLVTLWGIHTGAVCS